MKVTVTPSLLGTRVLVLEDDYYLATDLEAALREAGAKVVGPFADVADALEALATDPPDCALVDLNLGQGINFDLPYKLAQQSVPFAFVTGYDRAVIPDKFSETIRVEKPIAVQKVAYITERLISGQRV